MGVLLNGQNRRLSVFVNIPAMANTADLDQENARKDLLNNPIIANTDPICPLAPGKLLVSGRKWIVSQ